MFDIMFVTAIDIMIFISVFFLLCLEFYIIYKIIKDEKDERNQLNNTGHTILDEIKIINSNKENYKTIDNN